MAQLEENSGVFSLEIKIDGSVIDGAIEVISITVEQEINRITSAQIKIADGGAFGAVNDPFQNSNGNSFIPGKEIQIDLGYEDSRNLAFKGIIVGQRLVAKRNTSYIQISCKDKSFLLTKTRTNTIQDGKSDSDVFKAMANTAGLSIDTSSLSPYPSPAVQHNCSDWDYLVVRSEINNLFVSTAENKISIKAFDFSQSGSWTISADTVVLEADLDLNGENLYSGFEITSWDQKSQAIVTKNNAISDSLSQGNLTASSISSSLGMPKMSKFTSANIGETEMDTFTKSWISKSVLTKVQGRLKVVGTTDIKAGDLVELSNFSDRFNGKAFVSKVVQEAVDGDWFSVLFLGTNSRWHSSLPDIEDSRAIGLLPSTSGPQIGKVTKINEDPDNEFRVEIELPSFDNGKNENKIWARLTFPYASNEAGFFFFPEIGDEVLVSFLGNDPRFPVITGSIYSSKNVPKEVPSDKNELKSIYSKSGISISFEDEKKILTVKTPGGHELIFSDEDKNIIMKDLNGNKLTMDDGGISFSSIKDIKMDASGDIKLSATGNVELAATSDLKGSGLNVEFSAQTGFTGKGNATAEISASGQTTVKGAMVMIN
ncbi:hypothetical protein JYB64_08725 [Algoriphagus aestuarii]|nr:hypothetical protein [Algoriphagus aestuarii]